MIKCSHCWRSASSCIRSALMKPFIRIFVRNMRTGCWRCRKGKLRLLAPSLYYLITNKWTFYRQYFCLMTAVTANWSFVVIFASYAVILVTFTEVHAFNDLLNCWSFRFVLGTEYCWNIPYEWIRCLLCLMLQWPSGVWDQLSVCMSKVSFSCASQLWCSTFTRLS